MAFAPIEAALKTVAQGGFVVVVDDENRENEGDLILAADCATPEALAFMVRHTSGVVCAALTGERLDALDLPQMTARNDESMRTAFTVTVDARDGVSTGISAADRAHTIRKLADPAATAGDFVRPGHIFPLRARDGGVLVRLLTNNPAKLTALATLGVSAERAPLPALYLRGISIGRLKEEWAANYECWRSRDLSARRYVYIWADGVYLQSREEPAALPPECRRHPNLNITPQSAGKPRL